MRNKLTVLNETKLDEIHETKLEGTHETKQNGIRYKTKQNFDFAKQGKFCETTFLLLSSFAKLKRGNHRALCSAGVQLMFEYRVPVICM
jgi:hypothetical protein